MCVAKCERCDKIDVNCGGDDKSSEAYKKKLKRLSENTRVM